MLAVKKLGIILEATSLDFEKTGAFNPASWQEGVIVHLFYRATDQDYRSSIGYAKLRGPNTLIERWSRPLIYRDFDFERQGVEDPEIVRLNNLFYLFYVAYDGRNALTAYALSWDLKNFEKKGIITPQITYRKAVKLFKKAGLKKAYFDFASNYQEHGGRDLLLWDKDVSLFPRKINGQFALIHRILPDIQIAFFHDFRELTNKFWRRHIKNLKEHTLLEGKYWFESRNIGAGCPPIETADGWLLIFHTVENKGEQRIYHASAALLDKENPRKVIGRLKEPLFSPTEDWEQAEPLLKVVFPTSTALFEDSLFIYYGAGDKKTAVASVNLNKLLAELKNSSRQS